MYIGLNKTTGNSISDLDHINQSISDILTTPIGTRVMRREYGSLLADLIDQPQNQVIKLKIMSAIYTAVSRWENRVRITRLDIYPEFNGKMTVDYHAIRTDTQEQINSTLDIYG